MSPVCFAQVALHMPDASEPHAASGSGGVLLVRFSGTPGKLLCVKPQRLEARGELSPDKVPHVFLGLFWESLCSSKCKILIHLYIYNQL